MDEMMRKMEAMEATSVRQQADLQEKDNQIRGLLNQAESTVPSVIPAPSTVASTGSGLADLKPLTFKGDKFDGSARNLTRFLNKLGNDFVLYPHQFTSERIKVAYGMSAAGEIPDQWAQQFFEDDPDGVRDNWMTFRAAMQENFGDPNLRANCQRELLQLRQSQCRNIKEYVTRFETLCAQAAWSKESRATTFVSGLKESIRNQVEGSEVNILD